ncbi:MAG: Hsp20/alpha crystallin family protein [Tuberibacillus sp.]
MDVDKLKKWLDVAQQFQGKDFWSDIFDDGPQPPQSNQSQPQNRQETNIIPQPTTDLYQTPTHWIVVVDLPGMDKTEIRLTCVKNTLTIKGEAKALFPEAEIIHSERLSGQFERSINLPESIEGAKPNAIFRNGLLIIHIPKSPTKTYQIEIE